MLFPPFFKPYFCFFITLLRNVQGPDDYPAPAFYYSNPIERDQEYQERAW